MPPSVTDYYRKNPVPPHVEKYHTDITAQQCTISEIYYNQKCVKTKKKKGK